MKSRKNHSQPAPMALESLENRQLMSATLYGTSLYVSGTAGNDSIQVTKTVGPLFTTINVVENGVATGSFLASSVSYINVYGNDGHDSIAVGNGITNARLYGGNGNDYLVGADGNDYLFGGFGADYIVGNGGNDYIDGSYDNDTLIGGAGHDSIYGGPGADYLYGQDGNDYMNGGSENDVMYGGNGSDTMRGGFGDDRIYGDADNDYLYGDDGSDWLTGGTGADCMYGGNGNDFFTARDGTGDYIDGGDGWDTAHVDHRDWWEPWAANDTRVNVEHWFE